MVFLYTLNCPKVKSGSQIENEYLQTNSVSYRHFIKSHKAKCKSKTKPPKSLPLSSVFSLLFKNAHLSCFLSQALISPKLPDYTDFFFHADKTALASPELCELQIQSFPTPLTDSHFCVSLSDQAFLLLLPTVCITYSLVLLQALHIDFLFSSTIPPPFQIL